MAERRMFAKSIIDSDSFIDMPTTARLLYFDLSMRADDDGFVNSPKKICRMTGASDKDMQILIDNQYIIPFESGIIVIKHWKIHNYIQKDRYKPTVYQEEKNHLSETESKVYMLSESGCIRGVSNMDTQVSVGEGRSGKDRSGEVSAGKADTDTPTHKYTRDQVEEYYKTVCQNRRVSVRSGFVERFMSCKHGNHWEEDVRKWVSEDIENGVYEKLKGTNRFNNFASSGTDWDAVAENLWAN